MVWSAGGNSMKVAPGRLLIVDETFVFHRISFQPTMGNWHLATGVYNANGLMEFYVDGSLVGTMNYIWGLDPVLLSNNFYIGGRPVAGYYPAVNVDDVRIYSRALSTAEVLSLYNSQK